MNQHEETQKAKEKRLEKYKADVKPITKEQFICELKTMIDYYNFTVCNTLQPNGLEAARVMIYIKELYGRIEDGKTDKD